MKAENNQTKALPLFLLVKQFAFMCDIPFFLLKDQLAAIALYKQSLSGDAYQ